MGSSLTLALNWLRTYVVNGVSSSGFNNPAKSDGIATLTDVDSRLGNLETEIAAIPAVAATPAVDGGGHPALNLLAVDNGATALYDAHGNPNGFEIPIGSTGGNSHLGVYPLTRQDEIAALAGKTIAIAATFTVTSGFLPAVTLSQNSPIDVGRNLGVYGGAAISQEISGTTLTVVGGDYVVTGTEAAIGLLTIVAGASPVQTSGRQLVLADVAYSITSSNSALGAGGDTVARAIAAQAASRFGCSIFDEMGDNTGSLANETTFITDPATNYPVGWQIPIGQYGGASSLSWLYWLYPEDQAIWQGALVRITVLLQTSANYGRIIEFFAFSNDLPSGGPSFGNQWVTYNENVGATQRKVVLEGVTDPGITRFVLAISNPATSGAGDVITATTDTIQVTDMFVEILATSNPALLRPAEATARLIQHKAMRDSDRAEIRSRLRQGLIKVAASGADYTSVAAALAAATPGCRIVVAAGTYSETLVFPLVPDITLEGAGAGQTKIQLLQADSVAVASTAANSASDFHKTVLVKGVTFIVENGRYASHPDATNHDWRQRIAYEDCEFIHLGNAGSIAYQTGLGGGGNPGGVWTNCSALGFGIGDGGELILLRCRFTGYNFEAVVGHNWGRPDGTPNRNPIRIIVRDCTFDPLAVSATNYVNSFYFANLGSGVADSIEFSGNSCNGPIQCGCEPWLQTDPDIIPANKMLFALGGHGNTPAPYIHDDDGSRALMIASATTGLSSSVVLSGTALPILCGSVIAIAGAVGLAGAARGWKDVGEHTVGLGSDIDGVFYPTATVTAMGLQLGDRTSASVTLTVTIDGGSPINIVFNANYTADSNATIIGIINSALGAAGTASLFDANDLFRPLFPDQELRLLNSSSSTILRKTAVAFNGSNTTARTATSSDALSLFAGIAYEDIRPGASGRVKARGPRGSIVRVSADMIRSDSGSFTVGTTFGVGSTAGQFVASPSIALLVAVSTLDVQFQ